MRRIPQYPWQPTRSHFALIVKLGLRPYHGWMSDDDQFEKSLSSLTLNRSVHT